MIASRSLYRKLPVPTSARWRLAAPSRDFRRMLHGERSYSSRDESDHRICHHASRLLVNTFTYMKDLMVEMIALYIHYPRDCWSKAYYILSSRMMRLFTIINCVQFSVLHIQYRQELLLTTLLCYNGLLYNIRGTWENLAGYSRLASRENCLASHEN